MKNATGLLLDLIAIPSVSAMSNRPVIDYVAKLLDPEHWTVRFHPYVDGAGTTKSNLVAVTHANHSPANQAELAFVCHTDTVPFDPAWEEAVHPRLRDRRIYGRGSCDVKGFLACVLAALDQIDLGALDKPLAVVLTADEEVGCVGAKRLAAEKAFSTRYMIIGEPTDLRPVRAGKGYALATITVRGREAHSAFPAAGRSAIYDAARVVLLLERLASELEWEDRNADFDPPWTTLNLGLIEGGTAKNIVPGECRLTVEWRPVPGQHPGRVAELIRVLLASLSSSTPGFDAELEVNRTEAAFIPSGTGDIVDLLSSLTGNASTTIAFGSEAAHLRELTTETVVFGPGDMTVAHKSGEFVAEVDLHRCVSYLKSAVEKICVNA